ncbi:MAG: polysaccharide biosynthesis protein [Ignavibacteria bacterium]|nr:polysaccharide biosynthesis protein [Ignavibacteria bacterium]
MIEKIFQLGREAAIYGLSSVVGRFINFLLVPLYTNFLLPSEYGVIATLYSYIAFLFIVYGFGMEAAYMRFVSSLEIGDKRQNFSVPLVSLILTSVLFSILLSTFSRSLASLIGITGEYHILIQYAAGVLLFDALATIPFAYLRMENKAMTFASIRVINILLNVTCNVVLIVGFGMKAEGILLANLIASGMTFGILFRYVAQNFTWSFSFPLYRELLKFGIPYIPAGLAGVAMQVVDRPILKALTNDATVGVYQANYKLGIFMMLVVGMFDYAWRPFFLKHASEEGAKALFSRVFTLFCAFMLGLFLVLSLFIRDIVQIHVAGKHLIHPDYWSGLSIVPWILLAYVFNGAYVNFVIGVYLQKQTKYLPYITGAGALSNIVVNVLLIPVYGITGAAIATLVCYVVIAAGIYVVSRRFYEVRYEWSKIGRLVILTAILFGGYLLTGRLDHAFADAVVRILIVVAFAGLLPTLGIIETSEVQEIFLRLRTWRPQQRPD